MTGEIGQLALCLALALAFVQAAAGLMGARVKRMRARGSRVRRGDWAFSSSSRSRSAR